MAQPLNLVDALQNYLSVTLSREKTISMNMANVDTPGYHSRDIDFQSEFKRAVLTSSDGQGELGSVNLGPASREVPGLMERADGNNVDIDREGLVMAAEILASVFRAEAELKRKDAERRARNASGQAIGTPVAKRWGDG